MAQEVLVGLDHLEYPDLLSETQCHLVFSVLQFVLVALEVPEDLVHLFHLWVLGNSNPYYPWVLAALVDQEVLSNLGALGGQLDLVFPRSRVGQVSLEDLEILGHPSVLAARM